MQHASHTRPGTERPWHAQQLSAIGPPNPFKDKQSCDEMELQLQWLLLQDWHKRVGGWREDMASGGLVQLWCQTECKSCGVT